MLPVFSSTNGLVSLDGRWRYNTKMALKGDVCRSQVRFILSALILLSPLSFAAGAASFTRVAKNKTVEVGKQVTFVWNYTVGNKDTDFGLRSPIWDYYNYSTNTWLEIASENDNQGWNWTVAAACPPSLKGRISKKDVATLVIDNVQLSDKGIYRCKLDVTTGSTQSREAHLTVIPASTTPTPSPIPDSTTPSSTMTPTATTTPTPTPSCPCKNLDTYKALVIFHVNWISVSIENRKEWLILKIRILFRNEPTFHDVCDEMEEKSNGASVFTLTFCFKKEVTKEYVKEKFEAFRNTVKLNVTISQLSIQVKAPEISKTPVLWWIILLIGICVIVVLAVVIVIISYRCCPERLQDCCTSICRCCPKCFFHEGTPPPQPDKDEETPPPNKEGIAMEPTSVARG